MQEPLRETPTLAGKHIWIIDDEFSRILSRPQVSSIRDDLVISGQRPVDRGTLRSLLTVESWSDDIVKALCEKLISDDANVTGFVQPDSAVKHLRQGYCVPDVIIFDLMYDQVPSLKTTLKTLEAILERWVSIVQVYAQDPDVAGKELEKLRGEYSARMLAPKRKVDVRPEDLAKELSDKLKSSLSPRLAPKIRRLSSAAVENVLVKLDNLPLETAVRLIVAGDTGSPSDVEFLELLYTKTGEAISSSSELARAVGMYAADWGVSDDQVQGCVNEIVSLLASNICERIQYDAWLFKELQSVFKAPVQAPDADTLERSNKIEREFFSFRVYDKPGDDLVRTGDIVLLDSLEALESEPSPHLFFVVTPPCDLVRFWDKTRGTLTLVEMYPLANSGRSRYQSYEHSARSIKFNSITSRHPFGLLSIPLANGKQGDYAMYAYEFRCEVVDGSSLGDGIEERGAKKERYGQYPTYLELRELGTAIHRMCRVSEPFLSGILSAVQSILFRAGLPDFPDGEKARYKSLLT